MTRAMPDRPRAQIVVWLPALCRKLDVPYCIVKVRCTTPLYHWTHAVQSKSRLGAVVHKKTATALAITTVNKEDEPALAKLVEAVKTNFNEKYDGACPAAHSSGAECAQRSASTGAAVSCRSAPRPALPSSRRPAPRSSPPATTPNPACPLPAVRSRMAHRRNLALEQMRRGRKTPPNFSRRSALRVRRPRTGAPGSTDLGRSA